MPVDEIFANNISCFVMEACMLTLERCSSDLPIQNRYHSTLQCVHDSAFDSCIVLFGI